MKKIELELIKMRAKVLGFLTSVDVLHSVKDSIMSELQDLFETDEEGEFALSENNCILEDVFDAMDSFWIMIDESEIRTMAERLPE